MGVKKKTHQPQAIGKYIQINLLQHFGAKGMELRMFAVTFHKSNSNTLDVSGTSQPQKSRSQDDLWTVNI